MWGNFAGKPMKQLWNLHVCVFTNSKAFDVSASCRPLCGMVFPSVLRAEVIETMLRLVPCQPWFMSTIITKLPRSPVKIWISFCIFLCRRSYSLTLSRFGFHSFFFSPVYGSSLFLSSRFSPILRDKKRDIKRQKMSEENYKGKNACLKTCPPFPLKDEMT